jgi:L-alanine-DL-glutamate epimerase-like enolase superfamily enzyme
MKIKKVEVLKLELPFKTKFKHSLYSRKSTKNIIIRIYSENNFGIGESLPRDYVTGETIYSSSEVLNTKIIPYFLDKEYKNYFEVIDDIKYFLKFIKKNELSAFASFETALINLIAKEFKITLKDILEYLNLNFKINTSVEYTAPIGDSNILSLLLKCYYIRIRGFNDIKFKISQNSFKKIKLIKYILKNKNIRLDANTSINNINLFQTLLNYIKNSNISKIEQPYKINNNSKNKFFEIAKKNNIKIILDEDICHMNEVNFFLKKPYAEIVNLRISKNGGIINSLLIYKKLKENNILVGLGCMVGETVLSNYNLILAKYLDFTFHEGLYDKYLFKKLIIKNISFNKNGKVNNLNIDINFNKNISNYENFLLLND